MKKLSVISIAAMVLVAFTVPAMAEGKIGGYAVWSGAEENIGPLTIKGWAYVDAPLVGGLVGVTDLSDRELAWGESTDENGFFSIEVQGEYFPEDMIVTVMGGIKGNWPFFGKIKFWLHQYGGGYFQINSLTTLVAEYAQSNPGLAYDRALEDVREFLEIPPEMPMESQINACDLLNLSFSSELFFDEAVKYRHRIFEYDDFVLSLIDEMSVGERHPFKVSKGGSGTATAVFEMVDLFSGLISGLSTGLNWDMAKKFYGGDTTGWFVDMLISGGDATGAKLDYIINKVDAMDAKLDIVIKSLDNITAQLTVIKEAIKKIYAKLEEMKAFIEEKHIITQSQFVTNIYSTGFIFQARKLHEKFGTNIPPNENETLKTKFATPLVGTEGVLAHGTNIYDRLVKPEGYLDLLCAALETTVRANNLSPFLAYQYMEGKYAYYLRILQQALQAYVEATHYLKLSPVQYESQRDKWIKGLTDKFLECVNRFVLSTRVGTISTEFSPGSESGRILARAYALADRARSGLTKRDGTQYGRD